MTEPWWRTFFHGMAVDLWIAFGSPERNGADVDFITGALQLPPGGSVLDVPCGDGRHSIELADRGFRVTGVDLSPDFLKAARAKVVRGSGAVRWEQRDMRDLPWSAAFDGAFCFGNSFGYLDHKENVEFLRAVASALKPGGRFLIDSGIMAESFFSRFQTRGWYEVGGIHMLIENSYEPTKGRLDTQYTFIRDGMVDKRRGSQQVYTLRELCDILEETGFGEFEAVSSLDREPFQLGSPRLLLVCRRR